MADKHFRVLLDLTDLHIESFKYVWMNVSPREIKTIADFKTSVLHKINLEREDIKLFVRDGLLLDSETIIILREDDTVKVQFEEQHHSFHNHLDNCVKESKQVSRKRNYIESTNNVSLNTKRCKRDSKNLAQEFEEIHLNEMSNKKEKKKHKKSHSISSEKVTDHSTFEENNHSAVKCHKEKGKEKSVSLEKNVTDFNLEQKCDSNFSFDTTVEKNENTSLTDMNVGSGSLKLDLTKEPPSKNDFSFEQKKELDLNEAININPKTIEKSEGLGNNCPKKKRKRRKKRKQVLETVVIDVPNSTEDNSEFKSVIDQVVNGSVKRKHVIYSSSPCKDKKVVKLDCNNMNEEIKNLSNDSSVVDEGISNVTAELSNNYPKISTPAQSDWYEDPSWGFSLLPKANLSSYCNKTLGIEKEDIKSLHNKSLVEHASVQRPKRNENPLEMQYTDLPPLNSRPDIGTHIAYKILELDENYSPVISDYREGIVKNINLDSEEMEIELLKHEIKPGRIGKFENLKDDEIPLPEIQSCDIVRWSALIDPKVFY